jgi:large subunit ribosomal protein L35
MPKNKTHKGLAKRVKVTARGKVKRHRAFTGHLLSSRPSKQRRRLRRATMVTGKTAKRIIEKLRPQS